MGSRTCDAVDWGTARSACPRGAPGRACTWARARAREGPPPGPRPPPSTTPMSSTKRAASPTTAARRSTLSDRLQNELICPRTFAFHKRHILTLRRPWINGINYRLLSTAIERNLPFATRVKTCDVNQTSCRLLARVVTVVLINQ